MLREILIKKSSQKGKKRIQNFPFEESKEKLPSESDSLNNQNKFIPQSNKLNLLVPNQQYSKPTIETTHKFQNLQSIISRETYKPTPKYIYNDNMEPDTKYTKNAISNNFQQKLRSKNNNKKTNNISKKNKLDEDEEEEQNFINEYGEKELKSIDRYSSSNKVKTESKKGLNNTNKLGNLNIGDKLQILEGFINKIKEKSEESDNKLNNQKKKKAELETNIEILKTNIRNIQLENRTNNNFKKGIDIENSKVKSLSQKANHESLVLTKELGILKDEVQLNRNRIIQLNDETQYLKNEYLLVDKDILMLKDEIKKCNAIIANENKEKEKIKNEIIILKKHMNTISQKIINIENNSNDFVFNVGKLMTKIK